LLGGLDEGYPLCNRQAGAFVDVYPRNRYGTVAPIREIQLGPICAGWAVAVDGIGEVFVSITSQQGTQGLIEVFAPSGSGRLTPIRTISLRADAMAAAADGTLYVVNNHQLWVYKAGQTTGTQLFSQSVYQVAVDSHDDIYTVSSTAGGFAVSEYPPGSRTPIKVIAGSNTEMIAQFIPTGIAVIP
jgi:hypothetical protein